MALTAVLAHNLARHAHELPVSRPVSMPSLASLCPRSALCSLLASPFPARLGPPRRWGLHQQTRSAKTKTVVKLKQLPQGAITSPVDHAPPKNAVQTPYLAPQYPTVVLQARRNMDRFSNCVLLTRVGGFYELYFEHAHEYGPLLNLKVSQKKTNAGPVPMAGFPYFQLERFLKILVQDLNRYVAIAEEFPNDVSAKVKSGGLMHDRRVTRVITPGTLIDENFIDPYANNYLMSIVLSPSASAEAHTAAEATSERPLPSLAVGLAWMDISTGHFYTQATTVESLASTLARVCPREIVLDEQFQDDQDHFLLALLTDEKHLITYSASGGFQDPSEWASMLESAIPSQTLQAFTSDEVRAGSMLLHYVKDRLQGLSMKLQPPQRYERMEVMRMDRNTMRALEVKRTLKDDLFRGSLLHTIRRTVTRGGARLLDTWLSAPSTSLEVIQSRQDLVELFLWDEELRENVTTLLKRSHDTQRLVQKFAIGRGEPDDLLDLASTIHATEQLVDLLKAAQDTLDNGSCLAPYISRLNLSGPRKLAARIEDAIDEEGIEARHRLENRGAEAILALAEEVVTTHGTSEDAIAMLPKRSTANPLGTTKKRRAPGSASASIREAYGEDREVWTMKPTASAALSRLHADLNKLTEKRESLTTELRERFRTRTLTLRWTPALGHICHIRGSDMKKRLSTAAGPSFSVADEEETNSSAAVSEPSSVTTPTVVSSSRSTRSFHLPEWADLGQELDQARLRIRTEETRVFGALRQAVVRNLVLLRRNAAVLDELDVCIGFAILASEEGFVRPILRAVDAGAGHSIVGGRHPAVESGLREQGRKFVANDCFVGSGKHGKAWLITGPNMAGKSTYLRQNALITILAQIGCYVPAEFAELGIVDAIFSRVGSADNLFRAQSTFMVEMLETATILRNAGPQSFVIMDEIGRGTAPEDGTAVAFACLHHLVTVNKCRTIFATHFHGLVDMVRKVGLDTENGGPIDTYCTDLEEDESGGFVYIHRLRKGVNRESHALKVMQLAGLPEKAIQVAGGITKGQLPTST